MWFQYWGHIVIVSLATWVMANIYTIMLSSSMRWYLLGLLKLYFLFISIYFYLWIFDGTLSPISWKYSFDRLFDKQNVWQTKCLMVINEAAVPYISCAVPTASASTQWLNKTPFASILYLINLSLSSFLAPNLINNLRVKKLNFCISCKLYGIFD